MPALFFALGEVTSQDWLRDCTSLCALPLWCWKVENVGRKQMFHCIYMIRLCTFYLIEKNMGFAFLSMHSQSYLLIFNWKKSNIPAILRSFRSLPPSPKKHQGSKPTQKKRVGLISSQNLALNRGRLLEIGGQRQVGEFFAASSWRETQRGLEKFRKRSFRIAAGLVCGW